jgi:hypothetical protein
MPGARPTLRASLSVTLLLAGCGPSWPSVRALGDPAFVAGGAPGRVGTVDILPIDLQVWTSPDSERTAEDVYAALDPMVAGMVAARVAARGYDVIAQMDWDGRYLAPDGAMHTAMPEADVGATAYALSGYGQAQNEVAAGLLVPYLPARLGELTGSDATLYIGGWAFAGNDRGMSTAAKVAIGVFAVAVVAVVVVAAIIGKDSPGDGVGKVLGGAARGAARVAGGAARVAGKVLRPVGALAVRTTSAVARSPELVHATVDLLDAMGRSGTHIEIYAGRPDYYRSRTPHKGRSAMLLEATLVDNRTGRTLWHARQRFPASPAKPAQVDKAITRLLAPLPAARIDRPDPASRPPFAVR